MVVGLLPGSSGATKEFPLADSVTKLLFLGQDRGNRGLDQRM